MRVLIKIAFRNLREHKAKTLIIGIIITMGISILIVGNSMMDTATAGIKRAYWSNYTGHIILSAATDEQLTLFGRQDMTSMNDPIPRIPEYTSIFEYCSSHPEIESVNPQTASRALMSAEEIEGREIDAEVSDWLSFAGMGAEMAYSIKSVFNILILIIAVVAVIIIMNTLVISVTERIPEIGTMRAIGAQKSFVRRMILIETVMISGIFGLIGILLGVGVLGILYLSGIQAPE